MIPLDVAWGWATRAVAGGSIVLGAGSVAVALARAPVWRARWAAWTLAGAGLVPVLGLVPAVPRWSVVPAPAVEVARVEPPAPRSIAPPTPFRDPEPDTSRTGDRPEPIPAPADPPAPVRFDPRGVALAAWGLVGAGWLAWWGLGMVLLARTCRGARPVEGRARAELAAIAGPGGARVRLLASPRVARPITCTHRRATILLPAAMVDGADPRELRFVLAHEWSHVERHDYRTWTLGTLTGAVWAVHPLYWFVRRQLRLNQDFLADDRASGVESPAEFAAFLVRLARARRDRAGFPLPALGIGGRPSHLTRRALMLLRDRPPLARRCRPLATATAGSLATLVLLLAAGVRLDAAPRPAAPPQQGPPTRRPGQPLDVNVSGPKQPAPPDLLAAVEGAHAWFGRVVDQATGRPIAGAEVWVQVGTFESLFVGADQRRDVVVATDADGSYRFDVTAEEQANRAFYLKLVTSHPSYLSDQDSIQYGSLIEAFGRGERPSFERIKLTPARLVEGVIVAPNGTPVAGVRVVARSDRGENTSGYEAVRTDGGGRFRVPLALKGPGTLWILPDQFEPRVESIAADRRGDLGTFRLNPGVRLRGRLVDDAGRPVGGVFVVAKANNHPVAGGLIPSSDPGDQFGRSALTLADGTFALGPLPPGKIGVRPSETRLSVLWSHSDPTLRGADELPKYRPLPGAFLPRDVQIRAGAEPGPLEIRAVPGVRVAAQLTNIRGEKKGFDTWADLSGTVAGRPWTGHVRANADGLINVVAPRGLESSRFQVMVNQDRKVLYRTTRDAPWRSELELPDVLDRDFAGIEVVSSVNAVVRIRATDREGRPIAGLTTSVEDVVKEPGREGLVFVREGVTAFAVSVASHDGGRQVWTHWLNANREYEVKAEAAGFRPASRKLTLPEGKTEEVTFVLERQ